jgi:AcrR family transcriptional regulator
MQVRAERRSNRDRTAEMRTRLLAAARRLFVDKGYAETGTPEVVAAAGVTRGALYHHFPDKRALFRAVVEAEAEAVATEIKAAATSGDALADLLSGARAYLSAMAAPGRTRLLLVEAPAVLGAGESRAIDGGHAERTLREGLAAAIAAGALPPLPLGALTSLLSAMFDRAALDAAAGAGDAEATAVIEAVLAGLAAITGERSG